MPTMTNPQTIEEMCLYLEEKGRPALVRGAVTMAQLAGVGGPHLELIQQLAKTKSDDVDAWKATIVKWCEEHDGSDLARRLDGTKGKGKDAKTRGEWDRYSIRDVETRKMTERPVQSPHEVVEIFLREAQIERSSEASKGFLYALFSIAASRSRSCRKYTQAVAEAAFRVQVAVGAQDRVAADQIVQRVLGQLQAASA